MRGTFKTAMTGSVWTGAGFKYFKSTGEFRWPKKGEYYLSGAIAEVYQAPNDLSTAYNIMKEVPAPPKTIVHEGFTYQLRN